MTSVITPCDFDHFDNLEDYLYGKIPERDVHGEAWRHYGEASDDEFVRFSIARLMRIELEDDGDAFYQSIQEWYQHVTNEAAKFNMNLEGRSDPAIRNGIKPIIMPAFERFAEILQKMRRNKEIAAIHKEGDDSIMYGGENSD